MNEYLKITNWERWQTYRKDRGKPAWIKVWRCLLRNPEWVSLTDAQRGQLVTMWLIAADHGGTIPAEPSILRKLCHMDTEPDIQLFISLGFIDGNHVGTNRQPSGNQVVQPVQYSSVQLSEGENAPARDAPPPVPAPRRGRMCAAIPPHLVRPEAPDFWPEPDSFNPPSEAQLGMLASMADEARCTVKEACDGAGVTGLLAGPSVTAVKTWLSNRAKLNRQPFDPKAAEAEAAKAKRAARRWLEDECRRAFAEDGPDAARAVADGQKPPTRDELHILIDALQSKEVEK